MNSFDQTTRRLPTLCGLASTLLAALCCLTASPLLAADQPDLSGRAKEAVRETSAALTDAGTAAADTARDLLQRVDEARLKNRTRDEIVAWVIVGVLVGALAGLMTTRKPPGSGRFSRLLLGLAGAFLGGIVVHVGRFDFGWGVVIIRYEELLFALLGAILLVILGKLIRSGVKKKVMEE